MPAFLSILSWDITVSRIEVVVVAGSQVNDAVPFVRNRSIPVQLELVAPLFPGWERIGPEQEHRFDELRSCGWCRQRPSRRGASRCFAFHLLDEELKD
jgi:hypothetical protein